MKFAEATPMPSGRARIHRVTDDRWNALTGWNRNLVLDEWGAIVGRLLAQGSPEYRISAMYIEYENVADPDTPVIPPGLSRDADEGVDYYNSLAYVADRDYLRVPLIASTLGSSDEVRYPKGNMPVFFAQTSGVIGVHGRPFSDVNNSRVFGAALVAAVNWADATQDLVLSRFYLDADKQQMKLVSSQLGVEWAMKLK